MMHQETAKFVTHKMTSEMKEAEEDRVRTCEKHQFSWLPPYPGCKHCASEAQATKGYAEAPLSKHDAPSRKQCPVARGVLDYFPDALLAVANCSWKGNEQHNPGEELHWAKEKSTDHADCILRHLIDRGTLDTDGVRHSAKVAWRALALLQLELEKAKETK